MSAEFESLGSIAGACLATLLVVAAASSLGWLVGSANAYHNRLDAVLIRVAVGLNLLGCLAVSLGSLRSLPGSRSIWLLLAGPIVAAGIWLKRTGSGVDCGDSPPIKIPSHRNRLPTPSRSRSDPRPTRETRSQRPLWLALFAATLALITLGPALCYPAGWDELVYHHELPRRWLADGWPAFYPDLPYSGFPSLGEILFWLMAPIDSVIAPRLLVWVCWMLGLAAVYRLLQRRLALYSAATLTCAFAASGAVLMISANCYVESLLLLNVSTLLLALESARADLPRSERTTPRLLPRRATWRHAAIVGILAGGAAAVKLTGVAVLALPCLWYVGQWARRPARRKKSPAPAPPWPALAICLLSAAIVSLPFYLRPWLLTGNPFYPYYAHWFTTEAAVLEMSRYHHALGGAFGVHTAAAFLTGPLLLAFNDALYDGAFGWQLLLLIFLAVLAITSLKRQRTRPFILWPAAIAAGLYVFWFFTAQQARFAIPAALGLVLLAAAGLRRFHGQQRRLVLVLILAATVISVPWRTAGHYFGSWMTAVGFISRAEYVNLSTSSDATDRIYLPLLAAIREHTPEDAKLLLLYEHRGFYIPRRYEIGTPFFQAAGFTPPEEFADPDVLLRRLADQKITHLVITNAPAGPDQVPGWFDRLEKFFPCFGECARQGRLLILWQSERYILLEVVSTMSTTPSKI
jgi:hypothetical protein